MTGFLIALGVAVLIVVTRIAYRRVTRGPRTKLSGQASGTTYRQTKTDAQYRADKWGAGGF
jgi:hypothetical protein